MRVFVLKTTLNEVITSDVPAKALIASLLISNSIRRDAKFVAYLADKGVAIEVYGALVKRLWADYNSARGILLAAIKRRHPGTRVRRVSWEDLLSEFPRPITGISARLCDRVSGGSFTVLLNSGGECSVAPKLAEYPPHHVATIVNIILDRIRG